MYAFLFVRRYVCVRACPCVRVWVCGCETDRQTETAKQADRQRQTDIDRQRGVGCIVLPTTWVHLGTKTGRGQSVVGVSRCALNNLYIQQID